MPLLLQSQVDTPPPASLSLDHPLRSLRLLNLKRLTHLHDGQISRPGCHDAFDAKADMAFLVEVFEDFFEALWYD